MGIFYGTFAEFSKYFIFLGDIARWQQRFYAPKICRLFRPNPSSRGLVKLHSIKIGVGRFEKEVIYDNRNKSVANC